MTLDVNCKKDCIFRNNGECKMDIKPVDSIFAVKKDRCIYYKSNKFANFNHYSNFNK